MADGRLEENDRCLQWLQDWQEEVKQRTDISKSERNKLFLSEKTMFDVASCIIGFKHLCKISFQAHPGCNVSAHRVNSDLVENVFCQQRGSNGQNDNPTYAQYGPTMNSILLGQTTTSKKSNTGNVESYSFHKPQRLPVKRKLETKKEPMTEMQSTTSAVHTSNTNNPDCNGNVCRVTARSRPYRLCVTEFLFPAPLSQSTLGGMHEL